MELVLFHASWNSSLFSRSLFISYDDIVIGNYDLFKRINQTVWSASNYGVYSGPYFPAFALNYRVILRISPYSVWIRENTHQKKYKYGHFSSNVYDIIQRNKVALSPYLRLLLVPQVTEKSHNKICCFHEVVKFCFEHWAIYHELLFSMKSSENPWLSNNFRGNGS